MDKDRFPLSSSREPNPLRPYYVPPSVGHPASNSTSQPLHTSRHAPAASIGGSARDYLPELDLDIKSTTSEAWQQTRGLLDTLVWRYISVLLAQPFDVAKTVLQVSLPPSNAAGVTPKKRRLSPRRRYSDEHGASGSRYEARYSDEETDEGEESERSDDIPDYFTSTAPRSRSPRKRRRTPPSAELSPSPTPTPKSRQPQHGSDEYRLNLKKLDSVTHAISTLYTTSGAVGIWRASNATFLYSILLRTTDSFLRSLLLALIGLPDIPGPDASGLGPGLTIGSAGFSGLDLSQSPNPLGSLLVVGLASCITGLLLAPLDLVRTRLIITPTSHPPRGLVQNLRRLPSLLAPSLLWLPTALYHSIPQTFSAASPLFLRRQLRISPEAYPSLWSLAAFTTSLTDLFLRLPIETILRRAQVTAIRQSEPELPTVVETAPYTGVWATVYGILYAEGETTTKDAKGMLRTRRGQGAAGLLRPDFGSRVPTPTADHSAISIAPSLNSSQLTRNLQLNSQFHRIHRVSELPARGRRPVTQQHNIKALMKRIQKRGRDILVEIGACEDERMNTLVPKRLRIMWQAGPEAGKSSFLEHEVPRGSREAKS